MRQLLVFLCACVCSAADVSGVWNFTAKTAEGTEYKAELVMKNDGGKLAGTISSTQGSVALEEIKVSGDNLSYTIPYRGGVAVTSKVSANSMKGTFTASDGMNGTIVAARAGAAAAAANVAGAWKLVARPPNGAEVALQLDLTQTQDKLAGTMTLSTGDSATLEGPKLEGEDLTFKVTVNGSTYSVKLKISGTSMKGAFTGPDGSTGTLEGGR
jgi:hypothetical protein